MALESPLEGAPAASYHKIIFILDRVALTRITAPITATDAVIPAFQPQKSVVAFSRQITPRASNLFCA